MIRYIPVRRREFAKHLRSTQTSLEDALWRELRAKRLDGWKFKRQVPIGRYIVDFVCFEKRLIVEADGPLHREPGQLLHDRERDRFLWREGFRVLHFNEEAVLGDLARVVAKIRDVLTASPSPDP